MAEHQIIVRNRWIPVVACVVIQLCLGTAYIWSVFQTGIANKLFGGDNAAAALTFSILLGVLTFGSTIGGRMQDKTSPRPVIMAGGVMLGVGCILASFATPAAPWVLWLAFGVLGGFGMGMIYSTLIACCQKWFPDKRGLITGIIVAALGFGGVIFTPVARALIVYFGEAGELKTFFWLGVIFLVVTIVGAIFVENPPADFKPEGWEGPVANSRNVVHHQDFKPSQMVKTVQFYLVTITLLLASVSGLMMIGFASPIAVAKGLTVEVAAVGVMIIAIFNSIGRLFWGYVSDKLGRKNTILLLLVATAVSSLFVSAVPGLMIFVLIGIMGFAYGGFLGVFPALTADYFGPKNMGVNYGIVLLGFGVGAIASMYTAGYYRNSAKIVEVVDGVSRVIGTDLSKMQPAFMIASAAAITGIVFMFLLKPPALQEGAGE